MKAITNKGTPFDLNVSTPATAFRKATCTVGNYKVTYSAQQADGLKQHFRCSGEDPLTRSAHVSGILVRI